MKRFLSILLILALAFALVACGEEETNKTESATESKTESTTESATESETESTTDESTADESITEESTPDESISDTEVMSPEEIFTLLEGAGGNLKMTVEIPEMMTMIMESENDENGSHSTMTTTVFGESVVEETYTQWIGDEAFNYYKDEDGNWYKEQVDPTENEKDFEGFSSLFVSDAYEAFDPATGRYVMKEGFTAEMDAFTISEGYMEIKDGTYTIFGKMSMSMEGLSLEGTITIAFSNLGGVTVTFPEVA